MSLTTLDKEAFNAVHAFGNKLSGLIPPPARLLNVPIQLVHRPIAISVPTIIRTKMTEIINLK